jgi:transcriptional antiterminator RfaH
VGPPHTHGGAWYVAYCQPFKERIVGSLLARQLDLNVYLPEIICLRYGREHHSVFFPRYLFVQVDLDAVPMGKISAVQGILRLISFSNGPQPLPEAVIEELRQRIGRLNEQGGPWAHGLEAGCPVRISRGPLRGLEAVFVGPVPAHDRVRVLIEFLGEQRAAEVSVDDLERGPPRARRTRGRGRPITPT